MARIYLGNRLFAKFSSIVAYARTDLKHFLDVFRKTPPAMFRCRAELDGWAFKNALAVEDVACSAGNIIRIHGEFPATDEPVRYSQLWARAAYENYRKAWAEHHAAADKVKREGMKELHADHVINKERILKNFPQAWVMLFPVPGNSNSPFGSLVEKKLPHLTLAEVGAGGCAIDGLVGFKIYSMEYPRDEAELAEQLKAIHGQVPQWFYEEVEEAINAEWHRAWGA